jgi:hypothetical protein
MLEKRYMMALLAGAAITASVGSAALTFADSTAASSSSLAQHGPGVMGTVTAVSGNTVTLTGRDGKTYTVDAGSAAITKDQTVSVTDIQVGDTLVADGTVSGASVAASSIHDGKLPMGGFGMGHGPMGGGVHGKVTAVSGTTLTVEDTNPRDNTTTTYTVDASNAKVLKGSSDAAPAASTLSAVVVGDEIGVMGTKSGTSVTATTIIDGPMPHGGRGPQSTITQ